MMLVSSYVIFSKSGTLVFPSSSDGNADILSRSKSSWGRSISSLGLSTFSCREWWLLTYLSELDFFGNLTSISGTSAVVAKL